MTIPRLRRKLLESISERKTHGCAQSVYGVRESMHEKDMETSVWGSDSGFMILAHSKKWQGNDDTALTNGEIGTRKTTAHPCLFR